MTNSSDNVTNIYTKKTKYAGNGLFASKDIPAGDLILRVDRPFLAVLDSPLLNDACSNCFVWVPQGGAAAGGDGRDNVILRACTGCKVVRFLNVPPPPPPSPSPSCIHQPAQRLTRYPSDMPILIMDPHPQIRMQNLRASPPQSPPQHRPHDPPTPPPQTSARPPRPRLASLPGPRISPRLYQIRADLGPQQPIHVGNRRPHEQSRPVLLQQS
ncbi:MAG: hypothetical protein LQ347_003884 [Umbilicaria vellea]|nr:MAG: hypothetical protein LQ347_003884 [Umbilicaria vellea]